MNEKSKKKKKKAKSKAPAFYLPTSGGLSIEVGTSATGESRAAKLLKRLDSTTEE